MSIAIATGPSRLPGAAIADARAWHSRRSGRSRTGIGAARCCHRCSGGNTAESAIVTSSTASAGQLEDRPQPGEATSTSVSTPVSSSFATPSTATACMLWSECSEQSLISEKISLFCYSAVSAEAAIARAAAYVRQLLGHGIHAVYHDKIENHLAACQRHRSRWAHILGLRVARSVAARRDRGEHRRGRAA